MGAPVGNRNAAKAKRFEYELRKALDERDVTALPDIIDRLILSARAGEPWAIEMVASRLDGKARQEAQVTGQFTHEHSYSEEFVSETATRVAQMLGEGEGIDPQKPISH